MESKKEIIKSLWKRRLFIAASLVVFIPEITWYLEYLFWGGINLHPIAILILIFSIFYVSDKRLEFKLTAIAKKGIVAIAALSILNSVISDFSIVGQIFLVTLLSIYLFQFVKFEDRQIYWLIIFLLFASLPLYSYLNITFGALIRDLYAQSIFSILKGVLETDLLTPTVIGFGNNLVNIDRGCSGVLSHYYISIFAISYNLFRGIELKGFQLITSLILPNVFYFLANLMHLVVLSYLFASNNFAFTEEAHFILANLVSLFAFGFVVFYRNLKDGV